MPASNRVLLAVALLALLGVVPHAPALAAQIPGTPCQSTGNGAICHGTFSAPTETFDTGAACGTGATAFEILGTLTDAGHFELYLNQQGLLTEVVIHSSTERKLTR